MAELLPPNVRQLPRSVGSLIGGRIYVPIGKFPLPVGKTGAEPARDRPLGTPQYLYLIFQLMQVKTSTVSGKTLEVKELNVVSLSVLPSSIQYRYSSRNMLEQTAERDGRISGYRDVHGRGLTEVTINGTFGQELRMDRMEFKTGWDRLMEFREDVFKASHGTARLDQLRRRVSPRRRLRDAGPRSREEGADIETYYVVNFFDFINEEQFAVDLNQFDIQESTDHNNLPRYVLSLKEAGEVVHEYAAEGGDEQTLNTDIGTLVGGGNAVDDWLSSVDVARSVLERLSTSALSFSPRSVRTDMFNRTAGI